MPDVPAIGSLWIEKGPRKRVYQISHNDLYDGTYVNAGACQYSKPRQAAQQTILITTWLKTYEPFQPDEV